MKLSIILLLFLASCGPTIGPIGGIHIHADFKVYIDGNSVNFSKPEYMVRAKHVHVEDMDGDVIHVHATGVTIGEFFNTLGMKFTNSCLKIEGLQYCSSGEKTLKFYVNGEPNSEYDNYLMGDLDKILISYGNEPPDKIKQQLASITDKAKEASGKNMDLG